MLNTDQAPAAPVPQIGIVVYKLSQEDQVLTAIWYHTDVGSNLIGTGEARRIDGCKFNGTFNISYISATGEPAGRFQLSIAKQGDVYHLQWSKDQTLLFVGVGVETAAAWLRAGIVQVI